VLRNAQAKPQATPTDHSDHGCPWLFLFTENVMAKQDWGAIQKQLLAEYAKPKISPKEWCEANGYNYATARRHIKIPAQGKENKAQKKCAVRNMRKFQKIPRPLRPALQLLVVRRRGRAKKAQAF
jgi:hypothetical protein